MNNFTIIIDSREQKPYKFPQSIVKGLKAGDYSLEGYEDQITIERKSKIDAFGSFGNGRQRFIRELERLSKYNYAAIVIESSLSGLLRQPKHSKMNPRSVINSLISWSIRYGVHVFFSDNRKLGEALVYRILEKYWKEIHE